MAENDKKSGSVNNPISGTMTLGLGGAAVTAIGAAIRENNVHKEAITVLVGGVITGAMAGVFGCCVPDTKDASVKMKIAFGALNVSLELAAFLAAPAMGEQIMGLGTKWAPTVVDGLIGDGVILGGIAAIGAVACCSTGGKAVVDVIRQTLWGASVNTATNNGRAEYTPPIAIAEVVSTSSAVNKV